MADLLPSLRDPLTVFPSMAITPELFLQSPLTHDKKRVSNSFGFNPAKKRLKVSGEGIPFFKEIQYLPLNEVFFCPSYVPTMSGQI